MTHVICMNWIHWCAQQPKIYPDPQVADMNQLLYENIFFVIQSAQSILLWDNRKYQFAFFTLIRCILLDYILTMIQMSGKMSNIISN